MIFQNVNYAAKSKLQRLILMVVFAAVALIIGFAEKLDDYSYGMTRFVFIGILAFIYIFFNLYRNSKKLYFIYFSDLNGKILFRFYHIRMFAKNYKAYEIPQKDFHSYEIEKKGFTHQLIMKIKNKDKIVAYPPISISSLTESELFAITGSLDKYKSF